MCLQRRISDVRLEGEHIVLRLPELRDADDMLRWENDPKHWLVSETLVPYTREQIIEFIEDEKDIYLDSQLRWMIEAKELKDTVGCIDVYDFDPRHRRAGLGILIDESQRGKGYGIKAIQVLLPYLFQKLDLYSVYAEVLAVNVASVSLFEHAGFERMGVRKSWLYDGEKLLDQYFYQRFSKD
jgi:diamine N-acetyltransferase